MNDTYNEFDPGYRIGQIQFAAEVAFSDLLEASPWLARQFLDECEEKMRPRLPSVHRRSALPHAAKLPLAAHCDAGQGNPTQGKEK